MKTSIICGFPGVGKSTVFNDTDRVYTCLDSDSSKFPKDNFPKNYIQHIKENIGKYDYIFVSTHKEVIEALEQEKIPFRICLPVNTKETKKSFLQRYKERGNTSEFINMIDKNWNQFLSDLGAHGVFNNAYIELWEDRYLGDFLKRERTLEVSIGDNIDDLCDLAMKKDGNYWLKFNGVLIEYHPGMNKDKIIEEYNNQMYRYHAYDSYGNYEKFDDEFIKGIESWYGQEEKPRAIKPLNLDSYFVQTFEVEFLYDTYKIALIPYENFIEEYKSHIKLEQIEYLEESLFEIFKETDLSNIDFKIDDTYIKSHLDFMFSKNGYKKFKMHYGWDDFLICELNELKRECKFFVRNKGELE